MCGICGIIEFKNKKADALQVRLMMQAMKHRGPDDEGVFSEENVALGFVRLSIIDLSPAGHQPMFSSDNRYVVVYNGEIYNYLELREELKVSGHVFKTNTDTEVLLAAYTEWGAKCLDRFNGMWAFVIYDRTEKTIFASRDRFGIKPFYYYFDDERLIFASEIPPILKAWNQRIEADQQVIFDYLVFNRTDQTEATFFKGIKKLQHGHNLLINSCPEPNVASRMSPAKWYDLRSNLKQPFKTPQEYKEALSESVGLRLRSDVPVGVCLSGGIDSSSIVSTLLKDHGKQDLNTFSAVYEKGQNGDESDFIGTYKDEVFRMFFTHPTAGTLEKDLAGYIRAQTEPLPTTGPYAQFKVMELARQHVVVTLDGQGADEQLAGYHYFFGFFFKDLLRSGKIVKLTDEIIHYMMIHHSWYGLKSMLYFLLPKGLRTRARINQKGYLNRSFINEFKTSNRISGNLYGSVSLHEALIDHFEFKLEHLLKWEDRNSMWFSVESRVPFLDYRLVERTLSLPATDVIRKGMTKHFLREAMKSIVPEKIRLRMDKVGFETPEAEWFRTPAFQTLIKDLLTSDSFRKRGIINVTKAMNLYDHHLTGKINISTEIWKWINLELWYREFIDKQDGCT